MKVSGVLLCIVLLVCWTGQHREVQAFLGTTSTGIAMWYRRRLPTRHAANHFKQVRCNVQSLSMHNDVISHSVATPSVPSSPALFRFGVIADIQYVDLPDAPNFQGTKLRRYRNSLQIYQRAIEHWQMERKVDFAMILGDLVDGKANLEKTQYDCLKRLSHVANQLQAPKYYCFGNHCHYCFTRTDLQYYLAPLSRDLEHPLQRESEKHLFFDWSPAPGWRFISVDGYDLSLIGASSEANKELSHELIRENNPNNITDGKTWFQNLPKDKFRWVPYNGGIGNAQLAWIADKLKHAKTNKEKVVFLCHQPVFSPNRPKSVLWNAEEVQALLWQYDNVVAWFAGHDHGGEYAVDPFGIHHIVFPAPIESNLDEDSFAVVDVFEDHWAIDWRGKVPEVTYSPWPQQLSYVRTVLAV